MLRLLKQKLLNPPHTTHGLLRCLSSALQNPQPFSIEGYLITSCGLTPEKATKAAKKLSFIKSPERPDSVIRFLKQWGFGHIDISRLVSRYPPLLNRNVEPNMRTLLDMGFSGPDLSRVVINNPQILTLSNIRLRIEFWRDFVGYDKKKLTMIFKKNRSIIAHNPASIAENIALLKSFGLSDNQIQRLLCLASHVCTSSKNAIQTLLKWTGDLGLEIDSGGFIHALNALACCGRTQFEAKKVLLKKYGWLDDEFLSAFHKSPNFICFSQRSIEAKMEFFVGSARCSASDIALRPLLLEYSLEKRLMPRNHILQILKVKDVAHIDLHSVVRLTEEKFFEKFILSYEDKVPDLRAIYADACAGRYLVGPNSRESS